LITQKDTELLTVKAQEYDKVDIIKTLAEMEAKYKLLNDEKDML